MTEITPAADTVADTDLQGDVGPAGDRPAGGRAGPRGGGLTTRVRAVRAGSGAVMPARVSMAARSLGRWGSSLPPWGQALVVYVLSRLLDVLIIGRVARFQAPSLWTDGPDPGYLGIVSMWDGDWYRRIAESGYPAHLPLDDAGQVQQNEWAFYPLYPFTVRGVMWLLGTGWPVSASIISLLCGALTVVVMRSLVEPVAGRSLALWTVVLFCAYPAAPVLQLAYAESMSMLFVVGVLWCLQRRWYLLALPAVAFADLSRPISVPLAATVGVHLLIRLRRRRRDPLPRSQLAQLLGLTLVSAVGVLFWPLMAAVVTRQPVAYLETESSWRASHSLVPLLTWWQASHYVLGYWVGPVVLLAALVAFLRWMTCSHAVLIAGELRTWSLCYLGYLLLVFDPYTAVARILLPLFPLGTLLAGASLSRAYRRSLAVAFFAGQVVWVAWLWRFSPPTDWPP